MMKEMMNLPGVLSVVGHMCEFGMTSEDANGSGPVLKPTRFLTNPQHIARNINKKCLGHERRVHLMHFRAAPAQVYPPALCKAILRGLREHLEAEGLIDENGHAAVCTDFVHNINDSTVEFYDDISGRKLNTDMVEAARREELAVFKAHDVYENVPLQRCHDETG